MDSSVLWIAPRPSYHGILPLLRIAGLLPVPVDSVEGGLHLLKQFRAGVVVLAASGATDIEAACESLAATRSPVIVLGNNLPTESVRRYLAAGCAAVIRATCPPEQLVPLLLRVASGQQNVVWLEAVLANAG